MPGVELIHFDGLSASNRDRELGLGLDTRVLGYVYASALVS